MGVVRCVEQSSGDLDKKVNYGDNTGYHGRKEDRKLCQKEDISFEFDSRNRRWYAVFLFAAEKDPRTMLPHEAKKICSLDLGVSEPVVVYDFDGAIITGLLAPKEVWKKRLKQRLFSQTTTTRSLLQRSTFTSSTSAFPLVVEERRARIASHNRIRCALLSIVFAMLF